MEGVNSSQVITEEQIEQALLQQVVHGRESGVTFDKFPYFLSEPTQESLKSVAYVYLKHSDFSQQTLSKYARNLKPASRAILLSGPTEFYEQALAKALAHFFEAELLVLDVNDFSLQLKSKYGCPKKESSSKKFISEFKKFRMFLPQKEGAKANLKDTVNWPFDERHLLQSLYKVLVSIAETSSIILYIKDVEKFLLHSKRFYKLFKKLLSKLSGSVLVVGSCVLGQDEKDRKLDKKVNVLFPCNIEIKAAEEEISLDTWKAQAEEETKSVRFLEKKNHIAEVLATNDLDCDDLDSIRCPDSMILSKCTEDIVLSAVSHHLRNNKDPKYRNGKLVISSKSLSHGLSIFQENKTVGKSAQKAKPPVSSKQRPLDNEDKKHIRLEVVPANELGVTFQDIGGLDDVKESLQELVMLPLQRPDLFKGELLKPCKGILLFGPPGTGKTMLAKAIASEAGASFINVKTSSITSTWFGKDEKNVRALFTLAAKVSPSIIFIDEVDSLLGSRSKHGSEATSRIKNEFMTHWDELTTKAGERILVLAATNRPFDLDEAIIRRFERRLMVGLPSMEGREMILKTLLAKEKVEVLDYKELAAMTEGYSGSDLKTLCMRAAYEPVRDLLQQEKMIKEKKKKCLGTIEEAKEEKGIAKRALNMEDLRQAKNQVAASYSSNEGIKDELRKWNELYGENGSRKTMQKEEQLTYFL